MYLQKITILALAFVTTSSAISVLLPLYTNPLPGAWQPVYDALKNYPSITFQIVVNINSGPGCSGCKYPTDPNYCTAISTLNSYKNAFTLGYVSTNNTHRKYADVITDLNTYANWGYYTGANVSMSGIFFDEMNNSATTASYTYYKNASAYAYANVPSDVTTVVFNPGAACPAKYFSYADFIVEYEQYYTNYSSPGTIQTFTSGYNNQAAILLHNTSLTANLTTLVHPMITAGIGAVSVCPDGLYGDLSLLKNLTAAIKKG